MSYITFGLVVLFCLTYVSYVQCAYECYQCFACSDPWTNATSYSNCTTGCDTCVKVTIRYPGGSFINKGCVAASSCVEKSLSIAGYGYWTNCCTGDLCNDSNFLKFSAPLFTLLFTTILFVVFKS